MGSDKKPKSMKPVVELSHLSARGKNCSIKMRDVMRLKNYSLRTEQSYCDWVERFIRFHRMRHPAKMGGRGRRVSLPFGARGKVAASTQNQALIALLFYINRCSKRSDG